MARKDSKQKVDSRISTHNAQNMSKPQAAAKVDSSTATSLNKPAKDSSPNQRSGASVAQQVSLENK